MDISNNRSMLAQHTLDSDCVLLKGYGGARSKSPHLASAASIEELAISNSLRNCTLTRSHARSHACAHARGTPARTPARSLAHMQVTHAHVLAYTRVRDLGRPSVAFLCKMNAQRLRQRVRYYSGVAGASTVGRRSGSFLHLTPPQQE